ncbi:DUF4911 domain-containing protein [Desulfopila sp. IMCC35008]|uniref:DUF4911 domain-containing protein n=1 Tax=Desulfopila sp. IMCC35008 TaxID=2653858 RepID=UPI0013D15F0F
MKNLYLRIAPDSFHYLKFILEGYDNLAILSSVDMKKGVVRLRYSSGLESEMFKLLKSIAGRLL